MEDSGWDYTDWYGERNNSRGTATGHVAEDLREITWKADPILGSEMVDGIHEATAARKETGAIQCRSGHGRGPHQPWHLSGSVSKLHALVNLWTPSVYEFSGPLFSGLADNMWIRFGLQSDSPPRSI